MRPDAGQNSDRRGEITEFHSIGKVSFSRSLRQQKILLSFDSALLRSG